MQDLEFPAACNRLKLTPDGQYLFATGSHAPRVRAALPLGPEGGPCTFLSSSCVTVAEGGLLLTLSVLNSG